MNWTTVSAAALALAVAACGTDRDERIGGGAAAGAATGAAVGALGGPVGALAGAGIGGIAGGVTGGTTSPETVNLGRPVWNNPNLEIPGDPFDRDRRRAGARGGAAQVASNDTRMAQRELNQRGFDAGAVDGVWGPQTARAMENFQRANNLETTGRLNPATRQALNIDRDGAATGTARMRDDRAPASMGAGTTSRTGTATGTGAPTGSGGSMSGGGTTGTSGSTMSPSTPSTGPGGTSNVGSGNQPGTGGSSSR